jgi:hypothetical protein
MGEGETRRGVRERRPAAGGERGRRPREKREGEGETRRGRRERANGGERGKNIMRGKGGGARQVTEIASGESRAGRSQGGGV